VNSEPDSRQPSAQLEESLRSEIANSEQRRAAVLALILLFLFLLASLAPIITGRAPAGAAPGQLLNRSRVLHLFLLGGFAAFEGSIWALLRFARSVSITRFRWLGYLTALVEISVPSAIILVMAQSSGASSALSLPPVFLYFIFISLAALRLDLPLCLFTGAVAAAEYLLVSRFLLTGAVNVPPEFLTPPHFIGKPLLLFIAGVGAAFVASEVRKQVVQTLETMGEHQRVLGIFGRHVSPAVLDRLVDGGLVGETREVCILFLDIRGFTAYAEGQPPGRVVDYLNSLFGFMVDIVTSHGGTVNKFLGDGFMALFGAPLSGDNDSASAVRAALEIREALARRVDEGQVPPTRVGIGVHRGEALTGLVGSAARQEYSVIGDVVNLASRVESLTKTVGAEILITQAVWERAGAELVGEAEALGQVQVPGREAMVDLYRLA